MKFLRWFVVLKNNPAGFYESVSTGKFVVGFKQAADTTFLTPVWGTDDPSLYTRRGAKFIVSELRRVGYNVRCLPNALLLIVQWLRARKANPWKK